MDEPTKIDVHVDQKQAPPQNVTIQTGSSEHADTTTRDLLFVILALLMIGIFFYANGSWDSGQSTSIETDIMDLPERDYITDPPEQLAPIQ